MFDAGCQMLDKIRKPTFLNPVSLRAIGSTSQRTEDSIQGRGAVSNLE
jgi:hypothetical protein